MSNREIVWQRSSVARADRERLNGHRALVIWLTGLSGAGKSTLAHALEAALHQLGHRTYVLDGDNLRHGLCSDLGFSPEDRRENLRRVAEAAKLTLDAGIVTIAAFISPMREDREMIRHIVGPDHFYEIYVRCPLEVCEQRDVKGLYKKARAGEIKEFTGVSASYEAPEQADLVLDTHLMRIEDCVFRILQNVRPMTELQ